MSPEEGPNTDRTSEITRRFLTSGLEAPSAQQTQLLAAYLELLLRWNARMNLTAVREPGEMIDRHLIECVFAARHLPAGIETLMDFGSGAGLPGIPIAIFRPEIRVVLAESQAKKATFLREVLRVLAIPSEVFGGRVESMPGERHFDAVTMRAVDKMEEAIETAGSRASRYLVLLTGQSGEVLQGLASDFQWNTRETLPGGVGLLLVGEKISTQDA